MKGKRSIEERPAKGPTERDSIKTAIDATPARVRTESQPENPDSQVANPSAPSSQLSHRASPEDDNWTEREPKGPALNAGDPYIGSTIDQRYFVETILGEGGMGVVYRCRHTIINKLVAMKVLRPDLARNEEITERFLNEARSASSIGNAHIIDISDFGRLQDGATYFIMEYLDGVSLAEVAGLRDAISLDRVAHLMLQLADGLDAAHAKGIIHRDLKPDNVFLIERGDESDFVKILDFGIAKASASTSKLTQAGQIFGTPHYMSPEQASGQPVDKRADIYAFGVILYELTTCRLPFDADHFMGVLNQHVYAEPVPPSSFQDLPEPVSPELESIILTCMAKVPDDRYPSMRAVRADLLRLFPTLKTYSTAPPPSVQLLAHPSSFARAPSYPDGVPPKSQLKTERLLRYTGIAFASLLFGALTLFALKKLAQPESLPSPALHKEKREIAQAASNQEAAPAPAQPKMSRVRLDIYPEDAVVAFKDGRLWRNHSTIKLPEQGEVVSVSRKGYRSLTALVEPKDSPITITLQKEVITSKFSAPKRDPNSSSKESSAVSTRPQDKPLTLNPPKKKKPALKATPRPQIPKPPALSPKKEQKIGQDELVDPWE